MNKSRRAARACLTMIHEMYINHLLAGYICSAKLRIDYHTRPHVALGFASAIIFC